MRRQRFRTWTKWTSTVGAIFCLGVAAASRSYEYRYNVVFDGESRLGTVNVFGGLINLGVAKLPNWSGMLGNNGWTAEKNVAGYPGLSGALWSSGRNSEWRAGLLLARYPTAW